MHHRNKFIWYWAVNANMKDEYIYRENISCTLINTKQSLSTITVQHMHWCPWTCIEHMNRNYTHVCVRRLRITAIYQLSHASCIMNHAGIKHCIKWKLHISTRKLSLSLSLCHSYFFSPSFSFHLAHRLNCMISSLVRTFYVLLFVRNYNSLWV